MLKCKLCEFETTSQISLSKHTSNTHKLKFPAYLIKVKYNGINPICQCGCKENTKYQAVKADFNNFIVGHQARLDGHFGDPKAKKRVDAIIKTRKAKFTSGEYDYIKLAVKNRDNVELGKKISKAVKGIAKPKPVDFGIGRVHSQKTKDKMSKTAKDKWITGNIGKKKHYTSKLEKTFANILDLLEIKYKQFLYAKEIKAFYDFYIPHKNIIIEIDGDFWHCNPKTKHATPKYESQKKNLIRDKEKEKWAKDNGYKLIRFWEDDINNNIKFIKQTLTEALR